MTNTSSTSWPSKVWAWLKDFPRRHKIITVLLLLYGLWHLATTPIKNPWASDAYTIRGRFPFDQGFELEFLQFAYNTADWHRRWCGGINVDRAHCSGGHEVLKPRKIDGQHYELTVYRDRYISGPAGWVADPASYRAYRAGVDPSTMIFLSLAPSPDRLACDSGVERLSKYEGGLFCMSQKEHQKYGQLVLPLSPGNNSQEKIFDFWLYSELDAIQHKEE